MKKEPENKPPGEEMTEQDLINQDVELYGIGYGLKNCNNILVRLPPDRVFVITKNKEKEMKNKDEKIKISNGCVGYLIDHVGELRSKNKLLNAENRVMNNFFSMFDRIGDKKTQGYGEDRLHQAKKEFEEAINLKDKEIEESNKCRMVASKI